MSNPFFTVRDIPILLAMFVWYLVTWPFFWVWRIVKRLWARATGGGSH